MKVYVNMLSQSIANFYSEVKIMDAQEILNIIKSFFDAILKIFESLGIIKPKAEEGGEETTA